MRRLSCSLTVDAVKSRRKTVTRRHIDTWRNLKPGDHLLLVEKAMGLPRGSKQVVLAEVEVVAVDDVQLYGISDDELAAEGFPHLDHIEFVQFWLESHHVPPFLTPAAELAYDVRRIEWRYLP